MIRTRRRTKPWYRSFCSVTSGTHIQTEILEKWNYLCVDCNSVYIMSIAYNRKVSCRPSIDIILIFLNVALNNTVPYLTDTDDINAPIIPNTAKCSAMPIVMNPSPELPQVLNRYGARTVLLVVCLHALLFPCWHLAMCAVPLAQHYRLSHYWNISHVINLRIQIHYI